MGCSLLIYVEVILLLGQRVEYRVYHSWIDWRYSLIIFEGDTYWAGQVPLTTFKRTS